MVVGVTDVIERFRLNLLNNYDCTYVKAKLFFLTSRYRENAPVEEGCPT